MEPGARARRINRHLPTLATLLLLLLALAPRTLAPGDFWTADEAKHWSVRAEKFLHALQTGKYAQTNQVGHPGVTTMWLGATGAWVYQQMAAQGWVAPATPALKYVLKGDYGKAAAVYSAARSDFALYRLLLRLPLEIVTSLWVVLSYLLLRRLLAHRVALLAALLLATDPFLVAHGRVLHVDALLTTFMSLAILSAMVAFRLDELPSQQMCIRWPFLIASGVAGGLAFLTKSPAIVLIPMLGLIALISMWRCKRFLLGAVLALIAWVGIVIAVWIALWPAAWVDPVDAVMTVVNEVSNNGGVPHSWGNFFMGQVIRDPGPVYYTVATVLRLTPWAMIGLLLSGISLFKREARRAYLSPAVGVLALFALGFVVLMSIPPKKFDRYILPIFPMLNVIAAIGIVATFDLLWQLFRHWSAKQRGSAAGASLSPSPSRSAFALLTGVLTLLVALNLLWYHPYEMAYYNPLVGGGPVAARSMYVGWGEGLEEAGAYIAAQPNGCDRPVGSWYELVILPYVCSAVMELNWSLVPGKMDYVVLYINQMQRDIKIETTKMLEERGSLVHTVRIHDVDYAYVYQLALPNQHRLSADFGSAIRLIGYDLDTSSLRSSSRLLLTLQWQARAPIEKDYLLFVHVFDEAGHLVGQTDAPPAGPDVLTHTWRTNHYMTWYHPVPVPADVPPGRYWITLGLYDPNDFSRLPVQAPLPASAPADGGNALVLAPITIR